MGASPSSVVTPLETSSHQEPLEPRNSASADVVVALTLCADDID